MSEHFKAMEHYSVLLTSDSYGSHAKNEQIVAPSLDAAIGTARNKWPAHNVLGVTKVGNVTVDVRSLY